MAVDAKVILASEDCLQVQFEQKICPEVNGQISAFVKAFEYVTKDIPGVLEIVPTYCSVSIYFDEKICEASLLKKHAQKVIKELADIKEFSTGSAKIVTIPVCYEDEEFAPDLEKVALHAKLTKEEVIKKHSSSDYLIYMMGFLPGFPYLGGMDERLATPRLETPRTKIPAGSLAIGGVQTGLYPVESPGGWNIIGRTPVKLFDLKRKPFFLYETGNRIRFEPITREEFEAFDESQWLAQLAEEADGVVRVGEATSDTAASKEVYECGGGLEILESGLLTTVQDLGISGFQKYGIGQSGAMDQISFALANEICGNEKNAACLETTLAGPSIRFVTACDFAITGAVFENATLDGVGIQMNKKISAKAGSVLNCGFATKGLRSYIAFTGGLLVPKVFGSSSTNLKSKIGGYMGRKLLADDQLAIGFNKKNLKSLGKEVGAKGFIKNKDVLVLDCIKSSQFESFQKRIVKRFTDSIYTVSAESDRMGIRFTGQSLECGKTDIISDAIPFGAVQITSAGLPVVMAADRQTTGGYAKIACVTKASMCKLAQATPGTKVRFNFKEAL
ncbi:MAG: 5-oxoprolinase subunit PxpB [Spirochaetaceae bacterium]|nr:5-oxoprolinase subunit PxpB [Spirochaetaceae bacterium]